MRGGEHPRLVVYPRFHFHTKQVDDFSLFLQDKTLTCRRNPTLAVAAPRPEEMSQNHSFIKPLSDQNLPFIAVIP